MDSSVYTDSENVEAFQVNRDVLAKQLQDVPEQISLRGQLHHYCNFMQHNYPLIQELSSISLNYSVPVSRSTCTMSCALEFEIKQIRLHLYSRSALHVQVAFLLVVMCVCMCG